MRSKSQGIAGHLSRIIPVGVLGWALIGCDSPPDIQPIAPPGAPIPRKSPDEDVAQAQGETPIAARPGSSQSDKPPALPTARGETRTTAGGVKYETLKEGNGPELKFGQSGRFLYEGRLENGTVFDTTKPANTPRSFPIGSGVIEGWQEGLPGMKVGEVRKLTIPPELGYKAAGFPPKIPPNATLIFEVELVEIAGQ